MTSTSKTHKNHRILLTILIFITALFQLNAESIQDKEFGFSLDVPEGYQIADYTDDHMSYVFTHPNIPVTFVMKITAETGLPDCKTVLQKNLNKLKAKGDTDSFKWNNTECAISSFSMNLDASYIGWATTTPLKVSGYYLVLICYAPDDKKGYEQFIISTINSLCIDDNYKNTPGIITSYAYPKEGKQNVTLTIDGKEIKTSIDKSDIEAAEFTIELEYSVLSLYAKHKLWKEAWQRYYRMIYRDNAGRIANVSNDIYKSLYQDCKKENPQNPDLAYAQKLLTWTQGFNYKRAKTSNESDFTSLPATICGTGNDCDSRSLLICALLKPYGIDTLLLISHEYSHAMAAVNINAPGQTYFLSENRKEYLFGETTAKVTWGMIAQDQQDRTKWIPVVLP